MRFLPLRQAKITCARSVSTCFQQRRHLQESFLSFLSFRFFVYYPKQTKKTNKKGKTFKGFDIVQDLVEHSGARTGAIPHSSKGRGPLDGIAQRSHHLFGLLVWYFEFLFWLCDFFVVVVVSYSAIFELVIANGNCMAANPVQVSCLQGFFFVKRGPEITWRTVPKNAKWDVAIIQQNNNTKQNKNEQNKKPPVFAQWSTRCKNSRTARTALVSSHHRFGYHPRE